MNTKHKGDIAEQVAALEALRRGWGVLRPIGDNISMKLTCSIYFRRMYSSVTAVRFTWSKLKSVNENRDHSSFAMLGS